MLEEKKPCDAVRVIRLSVVDLLPFRALFVLQIGRSLRKLPGLNGICMI